MISLLRPTLITLLATAAFASNAIDTDDSASQPLVVQRLVADVLRRNPGLKSMQAAVAAAQYRVEPAGALPDPQFSGAVAPDTISGLQTPTGERRANIRAELSQELPWPGTLDLRTELARNEVRLADENVAAVRLELEALTRSAYAQWYYVHRALAINLANQQLVEELWRNTETRYAAGLTGQQDVLQADVELQHLRHQAIELRRLKRTVRSKIRGLLNDSSNKPLGAPASLPLDDKLPAYSILRDRALSAHPELRSLELRIAAGKNRESLAKKDAYPDFKVFGGYNSLWDVQEKRWVAGVGLSIPLNRSKYRDQIAEASAQVEGMQYDLQDRRARLLDQLEQAYALAEEAAHAIELYEQSLIPRTRENLSAALAEYGSGTGSFLDVLTAEQSKLKAELELERSRADYFIAIAQLQQWTGGSLSQSTEPTGNTP